MLEIQIHCSWRLMYLSYKLAVGKSCLTKRFEFGNFSEEIKSTIGVEFIRKLISIDGKMLEIQLWDTVNIYLSKAGQEQFRSMVRNFYRGSAAVFVVYSVNQRDSFELLSEWIKDIEENSHEEIIKVLVGNKNDLTRVVEIEEAKKLKEKYSFHLFFETSAKTGFNIAEVIYLIILGF